MTRCNIFQHQQIVPLRRHRSQQPAEQLPVSTSCHQVASASDLRPAPDDPHCDTHTDRHSNIYIQTKDCHQLIDSSSSAVWRRWLSVALLTMCCRDHRPFSKPTQSRSGLTGHQYRSPFVTNRLISLQWLHELIFLVDRQKFCCQFPEHQVRQSHGFYWA